MSSIRSLKLSCDCRFQHAFTACSCVLKVISFVWANQGNFFENANKCRKRMRKTLVATQLYVWEFGFFWNCMYGCPALPFFSRKFETSKLIFEYVPLSSHFHSVYQRCGQYLLYYGDLGSISPTFYEQLLRHRFTSNLLAYGAESTAQKLGRFSSSMD